MSVLKNLPAPSFTRAIRGYSAPEVDKYIDYVTDRYFAAVKENAALKRKLAETESKIGTHDEKSLDRVSAVAAEMDEDRLLSDAKNEAEKILNEARFKAEEIIKDATIKAENLRAAQIQSADNFRKSAALLHESMTREYERHIAEIKELFAAAEKLTIEDNATINEFEFDEKETETTNNDASDSIKDNDLKLIINETHTEEYDVDEKEPERSDSFLDSSDSDSGRTDYKKDFEEKNASDTKEKEEDFYFPGDAQPLINDELKRLMRLYAIDLAENINSSPDEKADVDKSVDSDAVPKEDSDDYSNSEIDDEPEAPVDSEDFCKAGENDVPNGQDVDLLSLTAMNVMKKSRGYAQNSGKK